MARWASRPTCPVSASSLEVADAGDGSIVQRVDGLPDPDCADCLLAPLGETLEVGRRYVIRAAPGVVADDGSAPFGDPPSFSTGPARATPLVIEGLDLSATDGCVVARFATAVAARAHLCVGADCVVGAVQRAHELALPLSAVPGPMVQVSLRAWDETTRPGADLHLDLDAPSPLPLRISEVLSRPLAANLVRQFVEVVNLGAEPIELGGLLLSDERGALSLPAATLGAGQVAVLAPRGFSLAGGLDPAPAPSALVVEVAVGHLGANGLKVGGETVSLGEPGGRSISRFSRWPVTVAGQSVARLLPAACDVSTNVLQTPGATSTPGVVP